jgi:hypothetical protein
MAAAKKRLILAPTRVKVSCLAYLQGTRLQENCMTQSLSGHLFTLYATLR